VANTYEKKEVYAIISYIATYAVQFLGITLVLFSEQVSKKKFITYIIYTSAPLFLSGLAAGLLSRYHISESNLAVSLVGPGVVIAELVKEKLNNFE